MEERIRRLKEDGNKLFSDRKDLESLWQEIALHFYPSMADITNQRSSGEDFADHLTTSLPVMARRTLGDALSSMLRPAALDTTSPGVWFSLRASNEESEDDDAHRWLEYATNIQRRAMYDSNTNFTRATKEGDHMFVTFGQCPLSVELNKNRNGLLYRAWHIRDVVWSEDSEGKIDIIHRKWKPTAAQLVSAFGDRVSGRTKQLIEKTPYQTVECRHVIISADAWEERGIKGQKFRTPWISIWMEVENDHLLEERGSWSRNYVIPRWMTLPGSQYGYSPAVVAALPDARLIQAMTLTLLEAGEKFADPPMIGVQEAIRSDVQLQSGGFTWIDYEYDERLGEALRPAYDVKGGDGLRVAIEISDRVHASISKAFFLDSLSLPPADVKEMTAFEVNQRISEWIRRAMPIFEPMEFEYNGALCEETFDILMREGAFGSIRDMPDSLKGQDVRFRFESPLHESADRRLGQKLLEAKAALIEMTELDRGVVSMLNAKDALRDTLKGVGVPADWIRTDRELEEIAAQQAEKQQMEEAMMQIGGTADIAKNLGTAAREFAQAGAVEQAENI